jgi:hypothetical protein
MEMLNDIGFQKTPKAKSSIVVSNEVVLNLATQLIEPIVTELPKCRTMSVDPIVSN